MATVEITLPRGLIALIDQVDADRVSAHKWQARARQSGHGFYVQTRIEGKTVYLHRFIMGAPKGGHDIDHINGDGLDNRRVNLREASRSANNTNTAHVLNKHGVRGINEVPGGFTVRVWIDHKPVYIGTYKTLEFATVARNAAAIAAYGVFALRQIKEAA